MITLFKEFKFYHSEIKVKAVLADALYGNGIFMNQAMAIFTNVQVISQLQKSQKVS